MKRYNWKAGLKRLTILLSLVIAIVMFFVGLSYFDGDITKSILSAITTVSVIWILYFLIRWVIMGFNKDTEP
ncbi:hypothetical protein ACFL20_01050 [Spirochaetota bacterium]